MHRPNSTAGGRLKRFCFRIKHSTIAARTLCGPLEERAVYFLDLRIIRYQLFLERFHALNSIAGSRQPLTELVHQPFALLAEREQRNHACDREEDEIRNHQLLNPGLLMVPVDNEGKYPILNNVTPVPVARIRSEGIGIRNNGSDSRDKGTDDRNM
jgi:hypothetical protein